MSTIISFHEGSFLFGIFVVFCGSLGELIESVTAMEFIVKWRC